MGLKDFKIERHYCKCHPETCCCDDYDLTYNGEVLARHLNKSKLEKLLGIIRDEVTRAKEKAVKRALKKERERVTKDLLSFTVERDPFNY